MESEKNGVKSWMRVRTVGLPTAWNRQLGFYTVRSTKPVVSVPANFVNDPAYSSRRAAGHLANFPEYPDPIFYLNRLGKYYLRHKDLLHLRIEQYNRYCIVLGAADTDAPARMTEESIMDEIDERVVDPDHRHYDRDMEGAPVGKRYLSRAKGVPSVRRRMHSRLAVSRIKAVEPIGESRERHYQQKLLLGLAWYAEAGPEAVVLDGKDAVEWTLRWKPPASLESHALPPITLQISSARTPLSFEVRCADYEKLFALSELDLVCRCCAGEIDNSKCRACPHAVGFHVCPLCPQDGGPRHRWRPGTLFSGPLRVDRCWRAHWARIH